ncbi:MAG TPA: hypothetical protein VNS09_11920 [Solirubrobacter sp.]|nr:hypothetical protein [Solirubrobacter sp.]
MADQVVIEHPNRAQPAAQLARVLVIALLIASAAVVLIVTVGGWATIEGAKSIQIAYIAVYFVFALFVARWARGVLPMIAALAVILGVFGVVAAPGWFARDKTGFTDPGLASSVLGALCVLLVVLQVGLILAALVGFRQRWNVEVERTLEPAPA